MVHHADDARLAWCTAANYALSTPMAKGGWSCGECGAGHIVPRCPLRTNIPRPSPPWPKRSPVAESQIVSRCVMRSVSCCDCWSPRHPAVRSRCAFRRTERFSASRGRDTPGGHHRTSSRPIHGRGWRSPRVGQHGTRRSSRAVSGPAEIARTYPAICPCKTGLVRQTADSWHASSGSASAPCPRVHCQARRRPTVASLPARSQAQVQRQLQEQTGGPTRRPVES